MGGRSAVTAGRTAPAVRAAVGKRTDTHTAALQTSTENVAGWVGGAKSPREHTVPREPANEALCASVRVERTDAHTATLQTTPTTSLTFYVSVG